MASVETGEIAPEEGCYSNRRESWGKEYYSYLSAIKQINKIITISLSRRYVDAKSVHL